MTRSVARDLEHVGADVLGRELQARVHAREVAARLQRRVRRARLRATASASPLPFPPPLCLPCTEHQEQSASGLGLGLGGAGTRWYIRGTVARGRGGTAVALRGRACE